MLHANILEHYCAFRKELFIVVTMVKLFEVICYWLQLEAKVGEAILRNDSINNMIINS
jgi:hypothetical protein